MTGSGNDTAALRALVEAYARHADDGDGAAFAALFLPNARLRTWPVDGSEGRSHEGADAIGRIPGRLKDQYESTAHLVGASRWSVGPDGSATGTTECVAHHRQPYGRDRVLTIRYEDTFGRDADGRWRFAAREVHLLRVDDVPA